jgi:hypothetical protein
MINFVMVNFAMAKGEPNFGMANLVIHQMNHSYHYTRRIL